MRKCGILEKQMSEHFRNACEAKGINREGAGRLAGESIKKPILSRMWNGTSCWHMGHIIDAAYILGLDWQDYFKQVLPIVEKHSAATQ